MNNTASIIAFRPTRVNNADRVTWTLLVLGCFLFGIVSSTKIIHFSVPTHTCTKWIGVLVTKTMMIAIIWFIMTLLLVQLGRWVALS